MIDINKIRQLSTFSKEYEKFKAALQSVIEMEARSGQWKAFIVYKDGIRIVWNLEVVNMAVEELKKDGFNVVFKEDFARQEKFIVVDWVELYADTDSVKE